ncbi:hypothetical protein CFU_3818 [Collimonas fungivorans Ter331]|uniref:Uncharacterized protein n=1 Tax=Collimonas fungivorans (strain Ter331) TaxID=1005048 RepID=G0AFZ2_COLFT|nr:hypothetical protein CFU_3818 [Collimonas fungivorans Ter331]
MRMVAVDLRSTLIWQHPHAEFKSNFNGNVKSNHNFKNNGNSNSLVVSNVMAPHQSPIHYP